MKKSRKLTLQEGASGMDIKKGGGFSDPNFGPADNKNAIETPFLPFQAPKRVWEALS